MLAILAVVFPFFALVLCGYLATRCGLLHIEAIPGLSVFVLYFALSAMLFHFGAGIPLSQLLNLPLMLMYALCSIVLVAATVTTSRNERIGAKDAAFGAMSAVYSNSGFMGIPLLLALVGESAVAVVIATLLVDQVLISSICLSIAHASGLGQSRGWRALALAAIRSLKGAARNPLLWSIVGGILFGLSGLTMPAPLDKTISLLSDSASPVALFTTGAILARNALGARRKSPAMDYVPLALTKLIAHPLLIFIGLISAQAMGFAFDRPTFLAVLLMAALPSAANVSMLAERFGADSGRIARVIMVSTVFSFPSFSALVWLLGIRAPGT
jgi:malonate transporter and related proteins